MLIVVAPGMGAGRSFVGGVEEAFWFSFAVGGLLFSFVALVVVMPVFLRLGSDEA